MPNDIKNEEQWLKRQSWSSGDSTDSLNDTGEIRLPVEFLSLEHVPEEVEQRYIHPDQFLGLPLSDDFLAAIQSPGCHPEAAPDTFYQLPTPEESREQEVSEDSVCTMEPSEDVFARIPIPDLTLQDPKALTRDAPVLMPSIAKLMNPLEHQDEVELKLQFESIEEAEAHVFHKFQPPPVDHTLPTNNDQVLAIVKAIKDAFHSDCYALDGYSSLKWWRENRDDTRLEVAAWKIYKLLVQRQTSGPLWPFGDNLKAGRATGLFKDRLKDTLEALYAYKSICKRMIVAPSQMTFVDNPRDDMRRTASNNKLNKGKGAKLQLAREVELKEREKEAGEVSDGTQEVTAQLSPLAQKRAPRKRKPADMATPAASTVPTPAFASVLPVRPAAAVQDMSFAPAAVPLTTGWCSTTTAAAELDVLFGSSATTAAGQFSSVPAMWTSNAPMAGSWMQQEQQFLAATNNVQATGLPMMGGPFHAMLANPALHSPLSSRKRSLQGAEDDIAVCGGRPATISKQ